MTKEAIVSSFWERNSQKLIFKDGEYKLQADVTTIKDVQKLVEAFDSKGKSLGKVVASEKRVSEKETKFIEHVSHKLIQYNYEFYLMPIGVCYTQPEIGEAESLLSTIWQDVSSDRFDYSYEMSCVTTEKLSLSKQDEIIKQFNLSSSYQYYRGFLTFEEICTFGNTLSLTSKNKLSDIEQYTKNKEAAILKWPNYKELIEFLYNVNLGMFTIRKRIKPIEFLSVSFSKEKHFDIANFTYTVEGHEQTKFINIGFGEYKHSGWTHIDEFKKSLTSKKIFIPEGFENILKDARLKIDEILKHRNNQILPNEPDSIKTPGGIEFVEKPINKPKVKTLKPSESKIKTYLIKNKVNGYYKIGKSKNPSNREKTLQSEEPIIDIIKTWDENIEGVLHNFYKDYRLRGEWFNLTKLQVKFICTNNW